MVQQEYLLCIPTPTPTGVPLLAASGKTVFNYVPPTGSAKMLMFGFALPAKVTCYCELDDKPWFYSGGNECNNIRFKCGQVFSKMALTVTNTDTSSLAFFVQLILVL